MATLIEHRAANRNAIMTRMKNEILAEAQRVIDELDSAENVSRLRSIHTIHTRMHAVIKGSTVRGFPESRLKQRESTKRYYAENRERILKSKRQARKA